MKNLFLLPTLLFAQLASAAGPFVKVDLRQDDFRNTSVNLLDDAHFGATQAEIIFVTRSEFELEIVSSDEDAANCRIESTRSRGATHVVRVHASTEYDDGSTCTLTIRLENGEEARVEFYSTGG